MRNPLSRLALDLHRGFGDMDEYAELLMLGVRVREVRRLREGSIYIPHRHLLVVDWNLSASDREQVVAHFLPRALTD